MDVSMPSPPKRRRTSSDHVVLNVGGSTFTTTASTLSASCSYFARLFSNEWSGSSDERGDDPIFIDRDPDAFKHLLSCMRNHCILLPEADMDLCKRVLLEAEFFGVDWLLRDVKHQALRHEPYCANGRGSFSGWDLRASKDILKDPFLAASKFDELFDGLSGALRIGVLPSRYFKQPDPFGDQPRVRQLLSAPPSDRIVFCKAGHVAASARPVAYALVEEPSGNQYVDAVICSRNPVTSTGGEAIGEGHDRAVVGEGVGDVDQQLVLASDFIDKIRPDWTNYEWGVVQGKVDGLPGIDGDMPGLPQPVGFLDDAGDRWGAEM